MTNNHSKTEVFVHFVFVTKWRLHYPFESDDCDRLRELAMQLKCTVLECNHSVNHFHCLVDLHPKISIADFACRVKSLFSGYYAIKCDYWQGFQTGYYACSVGKSTRRLVENYIQKQ